MSAETEAMKSQQKSYRLNSRAMVAAVLIASAIGGPTARADVETFNTPTGSTVGDGPVNATATFTISAGHITITIRDLLANPTSVGQTVNGVSFTLSNGTTAGSLASQTGIQRTVSSNAAGGYADVGTPTSPVTGSKMWHYNHANLGIEVTSLGNHAAVPTIIGDPNVSNAYSNGNGSITGNHNPFLAGTVTLVLNIAGVASNTTVTKMQFQFGTSEGEGTAIGQRRLGPLAVPEPSALTVASLGALAFIGDGLRRRLKKREQSAPRHA
jgi:hypothetical protein